MEEIKKFMWYMCTNWSLEEAKFLFGQLGQHIWDNMFTDTGRRRDSLVFFGSLDDACQKTIVNRAIELYP